MGLFPWEARLYSEANAKGCAVFSRTVLSGVDNGVFQLQQTQTESVDYK